MSAVRRAAHRVALLLALGCAGLQPAAAQVMPGAPQDMLNPRIPVDGQVRFCINTDSMLAEFDREVGALLAEQLLISARFHDVVTVDDALPLDYRFIQEEVDLFVEVTNECDALLGYPLPASGPVPIWMTVTRPYFTPPIVLALRAGAALGQGPLTIGSLIGSAADGRSRAYARGATDWKRKVYSSYDRMIEDVLAGQVDGALIWQPALLHRLGADPASSGLSVVDPPMAIPPVELAVALPSNSVYLRTLLDSAILSLAEGGQIEGLAASRGLSVAPPDR